MNINKNYLKTPPDIVTMLMLLLCLAPFKASATMQHPKEADTAKKCAICHYRWVATFFVEHRSTEIAQLEEKKEVVGSREMCISCHDGSVRTHGIKSATTPATGSALCLHHGSQSPKSSLLMKTGQCSAPPVIRRMP